MRVVELVLLASIALSASVKPVLKILKKPILVVEGCNENRIHIVGVSHGSSSSSRLVEEVIREVRPQAVVLELCEDRFISIAVDSNIVPVGNDTLVQIYTKKKSEQENMKAALRMSNRGSQRSKYNSIRASFKFASGQGLVGGVFVCLGLAVSSLQRVARSWAVSDSSSRIVADDEFTTAMRVAKSLNIAVRLADAPQNETLQSLKTILSPQTFLPAEVFSAFKMLCFSAFGRLTRASNERLSTHIESSVLEQSEWIDIPMVYRDDEDMLRSLYPILVFLFVTTATQFLPLANYGENMANLHENIAVLVPALDASLTSLGIEVDALLDSVSFFADILYVLLLLRMTKLIGGDRDIILAENIKTVCGEFGGADIVVVVGMLHSNGVARYLLSGVDPSDYKTR